MPQFTPQQDLKKNIATNRPATGAQTMPMTPEVLQRKELHEAIQQKKAAEMAAFIGGTIPSPMLQPVQRKVEEEEKVTEVAQAKMSPTIQRQVEEEEKVTEVAQAKMSPTVQRKAKEEEKEPAQMKEGILTHVGKVGSGKVSARENDYDPSDKTNDNFSLDYSGKDADDAHWLQFVNFSMYAEEVPGVQIYNTGNVGTSSGNKPFSTDKVTHWSVDSSSLVDPYYEAGFSNERAPQKKTKIFDTPGGTSWDSTSKAFAASKAPKAKKVIFTASFDTYLVVKDQAIYHVKWKATTIYDTTTNKSDAIDYDTLSGGDAKGIPKDFKDLLDKSYAGNKIK